MKTESDINEIYENIFCSEFVKPKDRKKELNKLDEATRDLVIKKAESDRPTMEEK